MMIPVAAAGIHRLWQDGKRRFVLILVGVLFVLNIIAATQVQAVSQWLNLRGSQLVGAKTTE
jgi:hypothetical protein